MVRKNQKTKKTIALAFVAALILAVSGVVAAAEGKVNVNSADAAQLALLPRVGAAVSQRIIDFREKNGRFSSPEDLMLVEGIGEKTFELMEAYIAVSGETTLKEKVGSSRSRNTEEGRE